MPFYKGQVLARIESGLPRNVILEAVDDASLVGAPQELIAGDLADLRRPYAVIVDKAGYEYLWPGEPIRLWRRVRDQRSPGGAGRRLQGVAAVRHAAGRCYTRFNEALSYVPTKRNLMNYVLAEVDAGRGERGRGRADHARDRPAGASRRTTSSGTRSTTCSARPASRSISASRSRWASSSAWPWPGRRSTCSRSRT